MIGVPKGSEVAYQTSEVWRDFYILEESDLTDYLIAGAEELLMALLAEK